MKTPIYHPTVGVAARYTARFTANTASWKGTDTFSFPVNCFPLNLFADTATALFVHKETLLPAPKHLFNLFKYEQQQIDFNTKGSPY
jgi:hypothetical protein